MHSTHWLMPFVAAQRLGRRLAETAAIVLTKVTEMGEAAIEGDRGGGLAGQRVAQPTVGLIKAALAQELERRDAQMSAEACLEMADADAELARDIGHADRLADPAAQDLAGALNAFHSKVGQAVLQLIRECRRNEPDQPMEHHLVKAVRRSVLSGALCDQMKFIAERNCIA